MSGYSLQNNKFPIRNKSSDKVTHSPFSHNNHTVHQQKNYIIQSKNITPNISVNHPKTFNKKNRPSNALSQSLHYQIEGDLEYDNKKNLNLNLISKNGKKSPFESQNYNHQNNNSFNHINYNLIKHIKNPTNKNKRDIPRKSPIPLPRDYQINNPYINPKYKPPYGMINNQNKKVSTHSHHNLFSNNIPNFNGTGSLNKNGSKTKLKSNTTNRSQSPILRIKDHSPKLSPNSNTTKMTKSPNPILQGNYAFLNNFKRFHLQNAFSNQGIFKNTRPKSSNNMDKILKIKNEDNDFIEDESDKRSRGIKFDGDNNINIIKVNSNQIINRDNSRGNIYNVNSQKNNQNHLHNNENKNEMQNDYNQKEENKNNNDIQIVQNYSQKTTNDRQKNNIYIQSRDNSNNNSINTANSNHQSKKSNRSHSTSTPNQLAEIVGKQIPKAEMKKEIAPLPVRKSRPLIHHFTHVGFDGDKDKANNQDIAFVEENFAGNPNYLYLSVCDGHGVEGHNVSGYIKKILPKAMTYNLKGLDLETNSSHVRSKIHRIIIDTFVNSNVALVNNQEVNSTFSGSTCVSVIFTPTKLICPNIGDSRAVMGKYFADTKTWTSQDLTRDHKPTEPDEKWRIENNNGRIQPFIDEETNEFIGPQRVWIKEDDVPGLAMTRSFGDQVAAMVGVMSEPEIKEFELKEEDKFFLVASDGVWEFISSEECINIIKDFYERKDMAGCCEYLYQESKKRWMKEEEVVDDITMLLVFLD